MNLQFGVKMKKVVIYTRVSTDKQTCENQILELTEYSKRCGYEVVKIYRDDGISSNKSMKERTSLEEMRKDAFSRKFDVLLCSSIDRLGRNVSELTEIMNELNELKIQLYFSREGIDTQTSVGRLTFTIFSSIAEYERNMIRERIMLGLNRARSQGKKLGRKTKINESLVTAVKLLRDKGMGIKNISKELKIGVGTVYKII